MKDELLTIHTVVKVGPLKAGVYSVKNPIHGNYSERQYHVTFNNTIYLMLRERTVVWLKDNYDKISELKALEYIETPGFSKNAVACYGFEVEGKTHKGYLVYEDGVVRGSCGLEVIKMVVNLYN